MRLVTTAHFVSVLILQVCLHWVSGQGFLAKIRSRDVRRSLSNEDDGLDRAVSNATAMPVYTHPTPPLNPTWPIVSGIAGSLTFLALTVLAAALYYCFRGRRRLIHVRSETEIHRMSIR